MFKQVDARFNTLKSILKRNNVDTSMVERAYNFADTCHNGQLRRDGTPYISHPVEVAIILADLNMDADVICAALLHDVVEDCGVSVKEIEAKFNSNIASLVDVVSAVDFKNYVFDESDLYEDVNFVKFSKDEQSFKKLLSIGKKNPLGLCIKFADRLHNLRTIGVFEKSKQLEKVKETERWILPLAKLLKAEYFYREIKNECFKISNQNDYGYLTQYKFYHNANKENFQNILTMFKEHLATTSFKIVEGNEIKEYKVFGQLKEKVKNIKFDQISQGQIMKVSNYNIYLLYENVNLKTAVNEFFNAYNNGINEYLTIINARIGRFNNKFYFVMQDKLKNIYYVMLMERTFYIGQTIGTLEGQVDFIDEDAHNIVTDYLRVRTRSGEIRYMPKNSTVLDFAFKIHRDIGMGFKYAIINNGKTHFPPYTKLNENDIVEIVVKRNEFGDILPTAELKWLAYVQTDLSKQVLIKYFEKKQNVKK